MRSRAWTDRFAQQHHGVVDLNTFLEAGNSVTFAKVLSVNLVADFARKVEEGARLGRCSHD